MSKRKYRMLMPSLNSLNEEIWREKYFENLNCKEKLVWIYLVTSTITSGVFSFNSHNAKWYTNSYKVTEELDGLSLAKKAEMKDYLKWSEINEIIDKFINDGKIAPLKDSNWIFLSYFTDYDYKNILEFTMDIKNLRILTKGQLNIRETITKHPSFFNNLTERFLHFLNYRRS